jgi:hypothetical protein
VAAFSLSSAAHGRATRTLPVASAGASAKLFGSLIDAALARHVCNDLAHHVRNDLALSDVALYLAGAAVVPSLTSDTYALALRGLVSHSLGLLTCHGCAVGRPPVTALHHKLHVGQCWPFAGGASQLGIRLALPACIVAVSVDHVPRELVWDMQTAPRAMELWGLVTTSRARTSPHAQPAAPRARTCLRSLCSRRRSRTRCCTCASSRSRTTPVLRARARRSAAPAATLAVDS